MRSTASKGPSTSADSREGLFSFVRVPIAMFCEYAGVPDGNDSNFEAFDSQVPMAVHCLHDAPILLRHDGAGFRKTLCDGVLPYTKASSSTRTTGIQSMVVM